MLLVGNMSRATIDRTTRLPLYNLIDSGRRDEQQLQLILPDLAILPRLLRFWIT